MREAFQRRRDLFVDAISQIKGFRTNRPDGAFYIFPEISYFFGRKYNGATIYTSDDFAMFLLNAAHVAAVPGSAFGSPNYIRFSYATSDEKLMEAAGRIAKAVAQLV
jgi:aspartate aminotransferase